MLRCCCSLHVNCMVTGRRGAVQGQHVETDQLDQYPRSNLDAQRQTRDFNFSRAGFGAAKHLAQQGFAVTLLDASPNPGGLSAGWRTTQGRSVEAGEDSALGSEPCFRGLHLCCNVAAMCTLLPPK